MDPTKERMAIQNGEMFLQKKEKVNEAEFVAIMNGEELPEYTAEKASEETGAEETVSEEKTEETNADNA